MVTRKKSDSLMKTEKNNTESKSLTVQMTFGEHLEVFRKMLSRIIAVVALLGVAIFCAKERISSQLCQVQRK